MPAVSIVIPTKNRPELLRRALASVAAQSFRDFEVVVVDDGAGAEETCAFWDAAPIRVVRNGPKQGGAAARNTGVRESSGGLIAFLDDDDEWIPAKLERQVALLRGAGPRTGFCFSSVTNAYDEREEVTHVPPGEMNFLERALSRFSGFLTSTLLVKRDAFLAVDGFDESLPSHQEPDLVIRLSLSYDGIGIDEPLTRMSMSRSYEHIGSNLARRATGRMALLEKHRTLFASRPRVLAKHFFRIGLWNRDSGNRSEARRYFGLATQTAFSLRYLAHYALSFV